MSTPDETYYDMSVPTLLTLAGPLLLFTWGIGTALMLPAQYSELFDTTVFLLFCLIGLAVSSVVCFLTADMRHVRYNALIAALCSIPTIGVEAALACTPVPLPLCAACAFFQGVAAGYMLVCWTAYLGVQANEHFAAIFVFEMVFAALLAFLVNNLASPVDHMTFAVLYVISTAALVFAFPAHLTRRAKPRVSAAPCKRERISCSASSARASAWRCTSSRQPQSPTPSSLPP